MDQSLKRIDGETQDQYFYRICMMKETLGFTWPQMAEIFNKEFGCNKGDTAYRKKWAAFKDVFDANEDKLVGENAYLEEINAAKHALEKERQKLYATKLEASRNLRQESRAELFYENIRSAIAALPTPEVTYRIDEVHKNEKEYVLAIADIQAGAKFKLDCNEYSLDICKNRFNDLLSLVVDYILENHIFKLHIVGLGDTIQGILRLSDLKLNETSVVEATVTVSRLIANFLNELSEYCYVEYYHTPTSNHSQTRNLGSKANELMFEDMEYVIGHYIQDMLSMNDSVNVHLHDGYDYIDIPIFNYNVTAMHGHTIKNLEDALMDVSAARRKFIDYLILGHYHSSRHIPGNEHGHYDTEVLMCPSFQGTDPYAFNKLGKSSKAACNMFVFDKKYGHTGTEKFILN